MCADTMLWPWCAGSVWHKWHISWPHWIQNRLASIFSSRWSWQNAVLPPGVPQVDREDVDMMDGERLGCHGDSIPTDGSHGDIVVPLVEGGHCGVWMVSAGVDGRRREQDEAGETDGGLVNDVCSDNECNPLSFTLSSWVWCAQDISLLLSVWVSCPTVCLLGWFCPWISIICVTILPRYWSSLKYEEGIIWLCFPSSIFIWNKKSVLTIKRPDLTHK